LIRLSGIASGVFFVAASGQIPMDADTRGAV
jgi:hypothetical protein